VHVASFGPVFPCLFPAFPFLFGIMSRWGFFLAFPPAPGFFSDSFFCVILHAANRVWTFFYVFFLEQSKSWTPFFIFLPDTFFGPRAPPSFASDYKTMLFLFLLFRWKSFLQLRLFIFHPPSPAPLCLEFFCVRFVCNGTPPIPVSLSSGWDNIL